MPQVNNVAYDQPARREGSITAMLVAVVAITLAIVLVVYACTPTPAPAESHSVHYTQGFVIDSTDAWEMHSQGLPTKEDVLNWHMCGYWGFGRWNEEANQYDTTLYEQLPGGAETWDTLYGIDPENQAFNYR